MRCEFCCLQECSDKYVGSVTSASAAGYSAGGPKTLPEAVAKAGLVQKDKVVSSKAFEQCLDRKAGCPKDAKKWDSKRKSVTHACLKEVLAAITTRTSLRKFWLIQATKSDPGNPDEHLQGCPDHGVDLCKSRKPAEYFEAGMTLEQCTDACLTTECGCPQS